MIDIKELRAAVETIGVMAVSTQEVSELLDRLEAAESTRRDDYQNWMTALDRNAELLAKLEAAEKEREIDEQRIADLMAELNRVGHENDKLRAKVAEMEQQEPIAWTTELALELGSSALGFDACRNNLWGENGVSLYALPGAHPKPDCGEAGHDEGRCGNKQCLPGAQRTTSVPEKITSVESGFKGMFLREAQTYKQGWNECRAAMIAAAPGGKP